MAVNSVSNQKTIEDIIDSTSQKTNERKTGELGKDDFLNLLVTQLRYQDPLNPTDDKEFIGQMAQFSSLEQMQNVSTTLVQSQAFALIGKHVTASIVDEKTKETSTVEGDVSSVKVSEGKTYVVVNGKDVPVEKITDVTEGLRTSSSNISNYTNLIGYLVQGSVYDPSTSELVGVSGTVKAMQKGLYEDYAVMDGVKVEISDIVSNIHSTDPDYIKNYLSAHDPNSGSTDNEVSVVIVDRKNNQKVPVTAVLKDYKIEDGKITATLDQLNVPVESISNIKPQ
ncbi:MAG: flagellar hook capping FlgD N-terminal domain-containing protein [Clostridiales bacterium]|jgi:flagellar basal-body rod modification protein FlgD|nr:flagellar hook capping protein [Eubacteriales bacterium]MDH7565004.1 flagellar hook capping FlgD N-terminal domain-containing protein [Clostridiales bacterium]